MSTYNTLRTELTCPHCQMRVVVDTELYFGDTRHMDVFTLGDRYKWLPRKAVHNGGRPENGNLDGEGYTVCPHCHRDFFVKVMVRNDQIVSVRPDTEKAAYISSSDVAFALNERELAGQSYHLEKWDPAVYAEKMKKSTGPVSAFFLIDSLAAVSRCQQWLSLLEPYGLPSLETPQYFRKVCEIYQANRQVVNFDFAFKLRWQDTEFQGLLRCHFLEKGKYEIELWLPGALANELGDKFRDGHAGFFCAFMPPAFYD